MIRSRPPGGTLGRLRDRVTGSVWSLKRANLIGRDVACDVRFAGDPLVSSHHLQLLWDQGAWIARDLRSANGTWVDGGVLTPQADVALEHGSVVSIGGAATQQLVLEDAGPPSLFAVRLSDGLHQCAPPRRARHAAGRADRGPDGGPRRAAGGSYLRAHRAEHPPGLRAAARGAARATRRARPAAQACDHRRSGRPARSG